MSRPTTKLKLINLAKENYDKLNLIIFNLIEDGASLSFDFSKDNKNKESHWKRDKNLKDVLIHLYEWHQLLLNWVNFNQKNEKIPFIPAPYNWRTYSEMNVMFCKKHENTKLEEAQELLNSSHYDVLSLLEIFTEDELFSKGFFNWISNNTLGSYFISATSSHYDWAIKKLKAHQKVVKFTQKRK